MPAIIHRMPLPALIVASIVVLIGRPTTARAQAGISWTDPWATPTEKAARNSTFDNGSLQSQSALGQLEEMTGATVDRSTTSTQQAPAPRAPQPPRLTTDQQIGVMVTGMLLEAVFSDLFSDNSAQQRAAAAEAAARAAAQAEALRVQQELARKARIQMARSYRADWDDRETTIENQLRGAFEVRTGTSFFGQPAGPSADEIAAILGQDLGVAARPAGSGSGNDTMDIDTGDPSVVDLRDSSLIVQPLRASTQPVVASRIRRTPGPDHRLGGGDPDEPEPRTPGHARQLAGYFGEYLQGYYLEDLPERYATARAGQALSRIPGIETVKAFYDFGSKVGEMREEIGGWYLGLADTGMGGAIDAARVLGSPRGRGEAYSESYDTRVARETSGLQAKIYKLVHGEIADHFEVELDSLEPVEGDGFVVPLADVPSAYPTHMRLSLLGSGHR
jgi:hypothetical protein